jgi:hypothetical protein
VNHSMDYIDIAGPEPDVSNYSDLHRWDRWNAWHRRSTNARPSSRCEIDGDGWVRYAPILKSEVTRRNAQ